MVLTNLKSDDFCGMNQSASKYFYDTDTVQNTVDFKTGYVGIYPSQPLHTPGEYIDTENYLKDIDTPLTKCYPSERDFDENGNILKRQDVLNEILKNQNKYNNTIPRGLYNQENFSNIDYEKYNFNDLTATTSLLKKSGKDISAVDYNRNTPLHHDIQDLTHIIDRSQLMRGGLNTQQFIKNSWSNEKVLDEDTKKPVSYKIRHPYGNKETESNIIKPIDLVRLGMPTESYDQDLTQKYNLDAFNINDQCNNLSTYKNMFSCKN